MDFSYLVPYLDLLTYLGAVVVVLLVVGLACFDDSDDGDAI